MHRCAAPGCAKTVASTLLMCARHWYQVPRSTRDQVWQAWNRLRQHPRDAQAQAGHRAAVRAAIQSVR